MIKRKALNNITAASLEKYLLLKDWSRDYDFPNKKLMVFSLKDESLVIPASETYKDFYMVLPRVIESLSEIYDKTISDVIKEIMSSYYDLLQFRIKSEVSNDGELPLVYASNCIEGLKELVLYSACAEVNAEAVCLRATNSAKQILDHFRLAQTEVGSFVINIDIRVMDEENEQFLLPGCQPDFPLEHKVVRRIGRAIHQIDEIVRGKSQMDEVLPTAYEAGITANMCDALMKLKPQNADVEIETKIRYASVLSQRVDDVESVQIRGNHFYVIDEISKRYRDIDHQKETLIKGTVVSVEKKKIAQCRYKRKISILSFLDGQYRVIKAELDEESFKDACDALRDEREVEIGGIIDMSTKKWCMKEIKSFRVIATV